MVEIPENGDPDIAGDVRSEGTVLNDRRHTVLLNIFLYVFEIMFSRDVEYENACDGLSRGKQAQA